MLAKMANVWRMPWSTLIGVCIGVGVILVTPQVIGPLRDAYDRQFPVLRMTGTVVAREPDAVVVHIRGEKIRGEECRLMDVYGYALDKDGRLHDATATRIDKPSENRVREAGVYDIGHWRVKPVPPNMTAIKVMTSHDCLGRVVLSTIAEVTL
jgi:hypothetical protein